MLTECHNTILSPTVIKLQWLFLPSVLHFKKEAFGNSLAVQWLGPRALTAGAGVQSLVRELRSCKL